MLTSEMTNVLIDGLISLFGDNLVRIVLYGSVARKQESSESDIDLAIFITHSMDEQTKKAFMIWTSNLDLRFDRVFSIIDLEISIYDKWKNVLPFYKNIENEGIELWKAA